MGYANIKSFRTKVVLALTDTQIFTSPWRAQRRYFLKKLTLTNEGVAPTTVLFYDDDLASATPPIRGDSVASPLLEFIVPLTSTLCIDEKQLPSEFFISGMVANSSVAGLVVVAEVEED